MEIEYVYDVIYPYSKGGVEKRIWEVSRRLARRGHAVRIFGMQYWDGPAVIDQEGVELHGVCPSRPLYRDKRRMVSEAVHVAGALLSPLAERGADVIDCQNFPYFTCLSAKMASIRTKTPLVITWHEVWSDYWYSYLGRRGVLGRGMERLALLLSDHNIAVSERTRRDLLRFGATGETEVIPNGIDAVHMRSVHASPQQSDLLFAGRLIPEKHVDLLLEALQQVRSEFPDIRCLIVGDGPERGVLEKQAKDLGLQNNVEFPGFLPDDDAVIAAMKASSVFVLPSTREGFGIAALEALGCGLPLVTIDHPKNAAADLVDEGTGFLSTTNPSDLAEKILLALNRHTAMREDCVGFADTYDWDRIADMLEQSYARFER
jgi:glycosyltransferase involved in cell wall biosynthesis